MGNYFALTNILFHFNNLEIFLIVLIKTNLSEI